MAADKPIPLVGRLAIQLEMLTPEEVKRAIAESASSGNPRLAQVLLQMGLLDRFAHQENTAIELPGFGRDFRLN